MKPHVPLLFIVAIAASPADAAEGTASASNPPPYAQSFQALDVNRDGVLTFSESFPNPRVSNNFNLLDTNADGVLSPGEYAQIHR